MSSTAYKRLANKNTLREAWNKLNKSNRGSRGIDNISISDFQNDLSNNLKQLGKDLRQKSFVFQKLRHVQIPKNRFDPTQGKRLLKIPVIKDRVVLKALSFVIGQFVDIFNAPFSYAYQEGKSVDQALSSIISLSSKYPYALEIDIKKYFDNIPINRLLEALFNTFPYTSLKPTITDALNIESQINDQKGEEEDYEKIYLPSNGIPQGSAISPVLSNFYLAGLDYLLEKSKIQTVRYADNVVVFANSEVQARTLFKYIEYVLGKIGLQLHPLDDINSKSKIRNLRRENIQCLGYRIQNGKVYPGKTYTEKINSEIKTITNPNSVGLGFKGAPGDGDIDTILSRSRYLADKIEGKAASINYCEDCDEISDISRILFEGYIRLFSACGMNLGALNSEKLKLLGIPDFKTIWKKHKQVLNRTGDKSAESSAWLVRVTPKMLKVFPWLKQMPTFDNFEAAYLKDKGTI